MCLFNNNVQVLNLISHFRNPAPPFFFHRACRVFAPMASDCAMDELLVHCQWMIGLFFHTVAGPVISGSAVHLYTTALYYSASVGAL